MKCIGSKITKITWWGKMWYVKCRLAQYPLLQEGERRRKGAKATFSRKWNETKSHDRGTKCSQNILSLPAVRMETVNEKMLLWCQGGVFDLLISIFCKLLINNVLQWVILKKLEWDSDECVPQMKCFGSKITNITWEGKMWYVKCRVAQYSLQRGSLWFANFYFL